LSNQLYEKSTHFLLELIQNADDNVYTSATPTLSFSYKPGCLRIDCNEVGFDASNVAAICGISQSTKSDKSSDGEFIGEKGIGFKSVFKVADAAWIASNEFTFKFDRTKPLGVITPLWEEFPEQTESCGTSIFLRLSASYDEQNLIKELHEFDTNLLIFLRRVEEINIEVNCADLGLWKKQIRKTQYEQDSNRVVVLQTSADSLKYLIRTQVVKDLPQETKRRDWTETNILLAFPLPSEGENPMLRPQNVYAFLPIRNYGFKFHIQADFILTASREDIESTLPWNVTIRDAISEAFLSSMFHFNEGVLKYVWPFYLPSLSIAMSGFFESAIGIILSQLGESPVFESCAGNMMRPSNLAHVPTDFCANGEPFTLCDVTKDRYLSLNYASWVIEAMTSVGVSQLTPRQFLEDLATLIATNAKSFHKRTSKWQTQLATALIKLSTDAELMPLIQDLAIIPLNDGTWTTARGNNIFFNRSDASLSIPEGIRILIVDSEAESNSNRRTLFTSLGVKAWEAPEICRLILRVHASAGFRPERLTTTQIISHVVFLYQAKWQPPKDADLWFATASNERFHGREIYIPGSLNADSAAARVFAVLAKQFPVMHADYLTVLAGESEWLDWLVQNLGLSRIRRLVTPVVQPRLQPMEVPPENESLSHNQLDPSLGDTQACKVDPPPDSDEDNIRVRVVDKNLTRVYRQPVQFRDRSIMPEIVPSIDKPGMQLTLTIPSFPFFPRPKEFPVLIQENGQKGKHTAHIAAVAQNAFEEANTVKSENWWSEPLAEELVEPKELLFDLSEEFKSMLHECDSSDIFQLIRDNWHHYSQWVEGAHMKWQSQEYVSATMQLKNKIGSSLVRPMRGLLPLHETVLEKLDMQLDQSKVVPALQLHKPEDTEWNLLAYFGVVVKSDVHYYLRCLTILSNDEAPDIDVVGYIYEQIQSRYTGNEGLIRYACYFNRSLTADM
jgi:hypothetical protein